LRSSWRLPSNTFGGTTRTTCEKIWAAVNDLGQLKSLSASIAILNFKAVAKRTSDPKMQQFLSVIGAATPNIQTLESVARDERPFLPELAWAYFAAYTTILYGSRARYLVLKSGLDEADKYLSNEEAQTILKAFRIRANLSMRQ
jgi:hypothetical protein